MKLLAEIKLDPVLVDSKTAGAICGVSRSTWLAWDAAGLCPRAIRINGRVLWSVEDLRLAARWGWPAREQFEARKAQVQEGGSR